MVLPLVRRQSAGFLGNPASFLDQFVRGVKTRHELDHREDPVRSTPVAPHQVVDIVETFRDLVFRNRPAEPYGARDAAGNSTG